MLQSGEVDIRICGGGEELARCAAELVADLAADAMVAWRSISIALSGGSTPRALYQVLNEEPYAAKIHWPLVHVFWGDERFVPPDDENSNYKLAWDNILSKAPIPEANIHRVHTEASSPAEAAADYELELRTHFDLQEGELPHFDLVLLGLGDDGHTASLFPGKPALDVTDRLVVDSPPGRLPPPVDRITLTLPVLNNARHIVFLAGGQGKADIVARVLSGEGAERLPAQLINPVDGQVTWLLDEPAAGKLLEDVKRET